MLKLVGRRKEWPEAALSFAFWTLRSTRKSYNMGHIRQGELDMLEWEGLCSHNPLIAGIMLPGELRLTSEQLEERVTKRKAFDKAYKAGYDKERAAKVPEEHRRKQREVAKRLRAKNPEEEKLVSLVRGA